MRMLLNNLIVYFRAYRKFFVSNILLTVVTSFAQVAIPLYFKYYLDRISDTPTIAVISLALAGFFLLLFFSDVLSVAWHYFITKLGGQILFDLRRKLMRHIEACDYEQLGIIGREKIKNILFGDTLEVFRSIVNFSINLCAKGLILALIFGIVAVVNIKVFVILVVSFVIGLWIANYSRKRIRNTSQQVNHEFKKASKFFDVFVESTRGIKTNLNYSVYEANHDQLARSFIEKALVNDKVQVFFTKVLDNINYIFSIIVITYLVVVYKSTSLGDVVLILYYSNLVFGYAFEIESMLSMVGASLPSFEHIDALLSVRIPDSGTQTVERIETVRMNSVHFTYASNPAPVLTNINITFNAGDVVKLQGANGSGKTTLIHLLIGLLRPSGGAIEINGMPRETFDRKQLQKKILYVGQEELFLNSTIYEYYQSLSETPVDREMIDTMLRDWEFFDDCEAQNDLVLDYKGTNLSAGQRRKLLVLKLLLMMHGADMIVIDELDANLDKLTRERLHLLKKELFASHNKIIIDITHDADDAGVEYTRYIKVCEGVVSEEQQRTY